MANLNFIAPINTLGYGYTGLNLLKSLGKYFTVSYFPIGQPQVTTTFDQYSVQKAIEAAKFFDVNAPCIRLWHQFDMAQFVGRGKHIGFPIFELDTFNRLEKHHLQSCDELFVCSHWAEQVIKDNGIECPVHVVPLGVDLDIFNPNGQTVPDNRFTTFFNCGKWEVRKGHDVLIEAFTKAFTPDDNARLWMMCENPFCTPEEKSAWEKKYTLTEHFARGKIQLIPRVPSHQEVAAIMGQTDCGVFPSRGEGWNLEALEMMAMGKNVILTDCSAHQEFASPSNSWLIPTYGKELAFDNKWFNGQGSWAKLTNDSIDSMVEAMRIIHRKKHGPVIGFVNPMLNQSGIATARQFSWENSVSQIMRVVCQR